MLTMAKHFQVAILDAQGKTVLQKIDSGQTTVDLEILPSGLYFMQVQIEGKFYMEKVIKN